MPRAFRLHNRTIWAIEDISAAGLTLEDIWERLFRRAEARFDPADLADLARARHLTARLTQIAMRARHGEYEARCPQNE